MPVSAFADLLSRNRTLVSTLIRKGTHFGRASVFVLLGARTASWNCRSVACLALSDAQHLAIAPVWRLPGFLDLA